jgi:colicin import membrane protein
VQTRNLHILNLLVETPEEFKAFIEKLTTNIYTRDALPENVELTHIIVQNEEQARNVENDFKVVKNNIKVLNIGTVKDIKGFLLNNGRFAMEPSLITTKIGEHILNKFFKENHNIHLDESFGESFNEVEKYEITNHLALGDIIDEISIDAFDKGFNLVSLRSFLDHAIIYLTYLKQAGLAGVPFEVEISNDGDFYVLNIHAPVKNFAAEYMMDAFGNVNSKDPLQYILAVVNRSTDFLDLTFIENPSRLVMTGFWNKSQKKVNGIAFNNVLTTSQMMVQLDKKIKEYKPEVEKEIEVEAKKEELRPKSLPGSILEMVVNQDENSILNKEPEKASNIIAFTIEKFEELHPDKSINEIDKEEFKQIINDFPDEDIISELVEDDHEHLLDRIQKKHLTEAYDEELERVRSTLEDEDDFKEELSDTLNEEVVNRVSGSLDADILNRVLSGGEEEDDFSQKVAGGEKDKDDFMVKISSTKENKKDDLVAKISGGFEKESGGFNVKFSNSSPEEKKKGMFDFIQKSVSSIAKDDSVDPKVKEYFTITSPKKIEKRLEYFANSQGLELEDLQEEDLLEFKATVLPEVVNEVLEDEVSIEEFAASLAKPIDRSNGLQNNNSSEFKENFKTRLEKTLEGVQSVKKENDKYVFSDENISEEDVQSAIKQTMLDTFKEEFKLDKANKEEIEKKEKEIIKNLSATLDMPEEEVAKIVQGASKVVKEKETQRVVDNIFKEKPGDKEDVVVEDFQKEAAQEYEKKKEAGEVQVVKGNEKVDPNKKEEAQIVKGDEQKNQNKEASQAQVTDQNQSKSMVETQLLAKIKKMEAENKRLENMLKAKDINNSSKAEVESKVQEVNEAVQEKVAQEAQKAPETEEAKEIQTIASKMDKNKEIVDKANSGQPLNSEESQQLAKAMEDQKALLAVAQKAESLSKKLSLEMQQKEALFKSEVARATKALKAKDMAVEKAKEAMQNLAKQKDAQVQEYKKQVDDMNRRLGDDKATLLEGENKQLKATLQSQERMVDVYKNKLENIMKSQTAQKEKDSSEQLQAENRSLQRLKIQLENQYNSEAKQRKSLEERYNKANEMVTKLRTKAMSAESGAKNLENANKQLKDQVGRLTKLYEKAKSGTGAGDQKVMKELEHVKAQKEQLQARISQLMKQGNSSGDKDKELQQLKAQNQQLNEKLKKQTLAGDKDKEIEHLKAKVQELSAKANEKDPNAVIGGGDPAKELEHMKNQNKDLQTKIQELTEKLSKAASAPAANAGNQGVQQKRLEQSVKKLNTELAKSKNEVAETKKAAQKMKQENMGLKNKVQMLAKELDKYKKAKGKKAA